MKQRASHGLAGSVLRAARETAGLTQTELSRRSGVPQPVISAYERSRRQPTLASLYELIADTGVPFEAALARARMMMGGGEGGKWRPSTARELAVHARDARARGDEAEEFRYLAQLQEDFFRADRDQRRSMIGPRPEATGDECFDAALAGLVEHLCVMDNQKPPAWTAEPSRFLKTFWFGWHPPERVDDQMRETPISLAVRGVFLTWNDLARV